jgi:tetratricopeptide (TPR) repeat protein
VGADRGGNLGVAGGVAVRVFISYAWESDEHVEAVRMLAEVLRAQGVDVHLDRYAEDKPRDWPLWMLEQLREADFVVVVASPAYKRRADGLADPGEGRGVEFEAAILRDLVMGDRRTWSEKILTILLPGATIADIPQFLGPYSRSRYTVTLTPSGVEPVLRVLTGQARFATPPIGAAPILTPAAVQYGDIETGPILVGELPGEPAAYRERTYLSQALKDALSGERSAVICPIGGGRGVGKTQLAAEYARACWKQGFAVVAWLNAEDESHIVSGLSVVAERLGRRLPGDTTEAAARRARAWLEGAAEPCLLVFDNAMDAELLDCWRPKAGLARVIVTTSVLSVTNLGPAIEVGAFSIDEAVAFLVQQTKLDDQAGAQAIAEELGCLPLALSQASWTIRKHGLTYRGFLARLGEVSVARLLAAVPGTSYTRSTAATIQLSAVHAESSFASRLAIDLLAVFSPVGCSRKLLHACLSSALRPTAWPPANTDDLLGALREASLITFIADHDSVLMHRVVQLVLRDRARTEGTLRRCLAAATDGLEMLRPPEDAAWLERAFGAEIVSQIGAVWSCLVSAGREDGGDAHTSFAQTTARVLGLRVWAIRHLTLAINLARALRMAEATADDCDRLLGERDPASIWARHYLGNVYRNQGRLVEAAEQYERVIALRSQIVGVDHPDTLLSRNNLGLTYRQAGQTTQAIRIHEEVLRARRSVLGLEHPDTLESQHNLARAYHDGGRVDEATALLRETIQTRARTLGHLHPRTINSRHNLALTIIGTNANAAADLMTEVIEQREGVLGSDHPATLASRHGLAHALARLGRPLESFRIFLATAELRAHALGAEHSDTLASLYAAADSYRALAETAEGPALQEQLRRVWAKIQLQQPLPGAEPNHASPKGVG